MTIRGITGPFVDVTPSEKVDLDLLGQKNKMNAASVRGMLPF